MKTEKLYERYYDNPDREPENYLGEFRTIHQLREDFYVDDFIAINVKTKQACMVLSTEFKGIGGGIGYQVIPLEFNCSHCGGEL